MSNAKVTTAHNVALKVLAPANEMLRQYDAAVHKVSVCRSSKRTTDGEFRTYVWECKTVNAAQVIAARLRRGNFAPEHEGLPVTPSKRLGKPLNSAVYAQEMLELLPAPEQDVGASVGDYIAPKKRIGIPLTSTELYIRALAA